MMDESRGQIGSTAESDPNQLIDSHCHIPHSKYGKEVATIVEEARQNGVVKLIAIGTNLKDSQQNLELAQQFDEIYPTIGIYPHEELGQDARDTFNDLDSLLAKVHKIHNLITENTSMSSVANLNLPKKKNFIAIGECGLDIAEYPNARSIDHQMALFKAQIEVALKTGLPLVIHSRNTDKPTVEILTQYRSTPLTGVAHCFASDWHYAKKLLDLNFYISFSGLVTYPSRVELLETVKNVPLDRFLVETDAPYLPPQGYRGQVNEPKYVRIIAQKVAEVKHLTLDEICQNSYQNTCRLFSI